MYLQQDSCANYVSVVDILCVIVLVIRAFQVRMLTIGTWGIVMHTPVQDDVESLLGSAKYIQGIADIDIGMRNIDALSSLFNSLTSMAKSLTGCTCYDLSSISLAE